MENCNQCIQKKTYPAKLIKNPAFIAKSKDLLGEYNEAKTTCDAIAMCCFIPLWSNQINSNYCTNWQFTTHQGITPSKPTTETWKNK